MYFNKLVKNLYFGSNYGIHLTNGVRFQKSNISCVYRAFKKARGKMTLYNVLKFLVCTSLYKKSLRLLTGCLTGHCTLVYYYLH